jgi:hypothetical protein
VSGGTVSSTTIEIINTFKSAVVKAKLFSYLGSCMVHLERGIPYAKYFGRAELFQIKSAGKKPLRNLYMVESEGTS